MTSDQPAEEWMPVCGFPSYEVSDAGRVRNAVRTYRRAPGSIFKQQMSTSGYLMIGLWRDGVKFDRLVHRLVLEAFRGPPPTPSHQGAHWDNTRTNNRLANLRWATPKENKVDSRRHGTIDRGEGRHNARLTVDRVLELRRRHRSGETYSDLAREIGLCPGTVSQACRGKTWAHVR